MFHTLRPSNKFAPADENMSRYVRRIQAYPLLSAEQERALARRWKQDADADAANQLVSSHLRLVVKIAMGYRGYGLPVDELIGQGNLGLMQAVDRFDPERGFRLATYAMWWIRAAIQEFIVHSWSLVKMGTTSEQKKLFFNLRRLKSRIQAMEEGDLHPENARHIATVLNVSELEVINMNRRLAGVDASLNTAVRGDSDSEWQDWLVDLSDDQEEMLAESEETAYRRSMLSTAMKRLSDRERRIVTERHLRDNPMTLEELSQRYGISRERVRQIEVGAIAKIKRDVARTQRAGSRADVSMHGRRGAAADRGAA